MESIPSNAIPSSIHFGSTNLSASIASSIPLSPTFSLYTHFIEKSLENHLYSNALFYASQLYTEFPNPQSLYLYANALFLSKDYPQAFSLLDHYKVLWCETFLSQTKNRLNSSTTDIGIDLRSGSVLHSNLSNPNLQSSNRSEARDQRKKANLTKNPNLQAAQIDLQYLSKIFLLYSVTCIEMNHFQQAEDMLSILWEKFQDGSITNQDIDRSTVAYYIGICYLNNVHRSEKAVSFFVEAAHAGMWCSIEKLCQLGYQEWSMQDFIQKKQNEWISEWKSDWKRSSKSNSKYSGEQVSEKLYSKGEDYEHSTTAESITESLGNEDDQSELDEEEMIVEYNEKLNQEYSVRETPASNNESNLPPKIEKKKSLSRISFASTASGHSSVDKYLQFTTPSPNLEKKEGSYGIISPPPSAHVSFKTPSIGRSAERKSDTSSTHSSQEWITPSPNRIDHQSGPPPIHGSGVSAESLVPKKIGPSSRRSSSIHSSQTSLLNQSNIANRLFVSSTTTPKPPQSIFTTPNSDASKLRFNNVDQLLPDESSLSQIAQKFINYIGILGSAYQLFYLYKCNQSLAKFQNLTPKQQTSPWVMGKISRCYFEMEDYEKAFENFMQFTQLHPYRLDDLEYFSTTLWHLKREKDLSFLAMRMSSVNKFSPQTLIAIGNCFSLQKDHEKALQFFEKASQLDPHLAYAYTLAGHEHVENDNTEDAMHYYREALRIDNRHYNAWYGLGTVYHRQENHEKARHHFEIALRIKPQSSVMRCYLGMTLKDGKMIHEALKEFDLALSIMPDNPMTKFKRAEVLMELGDWNSARLELEDLKRLVPREAYLYSTLGDVYAQIGSEEYKKLAADHYQAALQLGFKDHGAIKDKIAMLFESDMDNDSMEQ